LAQSKNQTAIKLIAIIASGLTVVALSTIIFVGHATGYEISLYNGYPLYLWLFIILSYILGACLLVNRAFSKEKTNWWIAGLAIVVTWSIVLILLPLCRGYFFFDANDSLITIGYIQEIQKTGHVNQQDFYPIMHILTFVLSRVWNISFYDTGLLVPVVNTVVYLTGVFLFTKSLKFNFGQQVVALSISSAPFFIEQGYAVPRNMAFAMFPLVLYLFTKTQKSLSLSWSALLFFILASLVMLHPFNGGILIIVSFSIILLSSRLKDSLAKRFPQQRQLFSKTLTKNNFPNHVFGFRLSITAIIFIVTVAWFAWWSQFHSFANLLQYIASTSDWIPSQASTFSSHGLSTGGKLIQIAKVQGSNILILGVATCISVYTLKKFFDRTQRIRKWFLAFMSLMVFFGLATFVAFFLPFRIEYYRILPYAIFPAVIITAWFLCKKSSKNTRQRRLLVSISCLAIITVAIAVGVSNVYPSPWTQGTNWYDTSHISVAGVNFFLSTQYDALPMEAVAFVPYPLIVSETGYVNCPANVFPSLQATVKAHLGYTNTTSSVGELYAQDSYWLVPRITIINELSTVNSSQVTVNDLNRLNGDEAANNVYSNGEFNVYYIQGSKEK
jgi:hypothetical protein